MISVLTSLDKRREFLYRLRREGFYIRMHGYEYFVRRRKFVCTVALNPSWGSAVIYKVDWNVEEAEEAVKNILKILKEIDPKLKIEIIKMR